ncbi:7-carboxy-7-deazaguanine synthase, Cx14CxxC type [Phyllobacterium sp. CL33Tsu]|uniref:7-carboxy-7-deazaguanine synthase n=1 Tax=Phyllobacterium sp. CL33Tsu TaxID=1798191 RepID=UPI0008E184B8|nr:7-carboxy-7-deazaguanine synthase [Phyllobacterium sp. CL33Tsu]SFI75654.1 7-carboxy-7-deazaguanine synthase, Cx14CxxC type [Phyllobacterium sp. CL33Tsu]
MTYAVKEIYLTLQGEGNHTGRAAVFMRFAGCNLWSGLERDRDEAVCQFCDTDFIGVDGPGGGKFKTADALAEAVAAKRPGGGKPYVICTGGEPLLQLDAALIDTFHARGFEVGIETNGTIAAPAGLDWICVSPKGTGSLVQTRGNELKLVYPQKESEVHPSRFTTLAFNHFYLQPLDVIGDPAQTAAHVASAAAYCLAHPLWRLSTQTHKLIGLP